VCVCVYLCFGEYRCEHTEVFRRQVVVEVYGLQIRNDLVEGARVLHPSCIPDTPTYPGHTKDVLQVGEEQQ
jgi:hypothetical protein